MQKTGFTLIELLVVIAIIGILSSIVLVSMRGATNRAKDARIISAMDQVRSTAEVVQGNDGDYDCVCTTAPAGCTACSADIVTLKTDIEAQGGTSFVINRNVATGSASYCVEVKLNSTQWWCVDSTLRSQQYASDPTCAAAAFACQ